MAVPAAELALASGGLEREGPLDHDPFARGQALGDLDPVLTPGAEHDRASPKDSVSAVLAGSLSGVKARLLLSVLLAKGNDRRTIARRWASLAG